MTKTLDTPIVVPEAVRRKAGLRRGEQIEFKVSGRSILIIPKARASEDYSLRKVAAIAKAVTGNPMSQAELRAENAELMAYGARQAKKAGIQERDIPRVIHESRSRRRTS